MIPHDPHAAPARPFDFVIDGNTTVLAMLNAIIKNVSKGGGNAIEVLSVTETTLGPYEFHLHVCVAPAPRGPAN